MTSMMILALLAIIILTMAVAALILWVSDLIMRDAGKGDDE